MTFVADDTATQPRQSRAHRDTVNKKVMEDPRMQFEGVEMPFDMQRMIYGGFEVIVD